MLFSLEDRGRVHLAIQVSASSQFQPLQRQSGILLVCYISYFFHFRQHMQVPNGGSNPQGNDSGTQSPSDKGNKTTRQPKFCANIQVGYIIYMVEESKRSTENMQVQHEKSSYQTYSYLCEQAYYLVVLQKIFFRYPLELVAEGYLASYHPTTAVLSLAICKDYCLALASILCFM